MNNENLIVTIIGEECNGMSWISLNILEWINNNFEEKLMVKRKDD